jgi:hypothetical protein
MIVYTLPEDADYEISVAPFSDSTGAYHISTGLAHQGPERGRDHRDAFVAWSDGGQAWSDPVRVNDDPPLFDEWLPEIAAGPEGRVYLIWYDWRDSDPASCGGVSQVYMARSSDGGSSWAPLGPVTSAPSAWSLASANLSPNQGDYLAVLADDRGVRPFWADTRNGDPDVYTAVWPLPSVARAIEALEPVFLAGGPQLRWRAPEGVPFTASVQRRDAWSDWTPLATRLDAGGTLAYTDLSAQPGVRYSYRLGVRTTEGEVTTGTVTLEVPGAEPARIAIEGVSPNPTAGAVRVSFRRPLGPPATLELVDASGRRWLTRTLGAEYGHRGLAILDPGRPLPVGLYMVRLRQGKESTSARVVILR